MEIGPTNVHPTDLPLDERESVSRGSLRFRDTEFSIKRVLFAGLLKTVRKQNIESNIMFY